MPATNRWSLLDGFSNLIAGFGGFKDKQTYQHWTLNLLDVGQLEAAWIARKIISLPAWDSARAWRSWEATQAQTAKLKEVEKAFGMQRKLYLALEKARLYGGAAMVLGVDQGKFHEELDLKKVGKGDLKFVHVVERWMLQAGPRVRDITSPWYGEPTYYMRSNVATPDPPGGVENIGKPTMGYSPGEAIYIHPSRVARFTGLEYPDMERAPDAWSDSILQTVQDALKAAGMVTSSVATMIAEAKLDVVKVAGLLNKLSTAAGASALRERYINGNISKSVVNALLIDKDSE